MCKLKCLPKSKIMTNEEWEIVLGIEESVAYKTKALQQQCKQQKRLIEQLQKQLEESEQLIKAFKYLLNQ